MTSYLNWSSSSGLTPWPQRWISKPPDGLTSLSLLDLTPVRPHVTLSYGASQGLFDESLEPDKNGVKGQQLPGNRLPWVHGLPQAISESAPPTLMGHEGKMKATGVTMTPAVMPSEKAEDAQRWSPTAYGLVTPSEPHKMTSQVTDNSSWGRMWEQLLEMEQTLQNTQRQNVTPVGSSEDALRRGMQTHVSEATTAVVTKLTTQLKNLFELSRNAAMQLTSVCTLMQSLNTHYLCTPVQNACRRACTKE